MHHVFADRAARWTLASPGRMRLVSQVAQALLAGCVAAALALAIAEVMP